MTTAKVHEMLGFYLVADAVLVPLALLSWWLLQRFLLSRLEPAPASLRLSLAAKLGTGVTWGTIAVAAVVLLIWAGAGFNAQAGAIQFKYEMAASSSNAVLLWSLFAAQSLFEELLFRSVGVGLLALLLFWLASVLLAPARQRQLRWTWLLSGLAANLVVAIAFAIAHGGNPYVTSLAQVNIALAGLALGQLFWLQGAPWGAWGWHWLWNAGLASLGLPVSGVLTTPALAGFGFSSVEAGIWSGGRFGPEGSIACTVVLAAYSSWLLWQSTRALRLKAEASPAVLRGLIK
jgi:hypothetical protein